MQHFITWICDGGGIQIIYNSESSSFTSFLTGWTLGGCNFYPNTHAGEAQDTEGKFLQFFGIISGSVVFNYEIHEETTEDPKTLIIRSANGDFAVYHFNILSSAEFDTKLSLSIYPNPVKDNLYITANSNLENSIVQIFDIQGKTQISIELSTDNSLNLQSLSKGIYFLKIKDVLGNVTTKKFVKY
ncbi:T9SS type A sorting domain-containing protein [Hyunsoonleella sp. SJ7]|uniref:T9SS type A sorting domain-containing protein n=1 Tax=Hyunsoonleella aquatilis TaxID=2762758 RepID=A0A923HD16_9FLAO|nr:T9SS type A sorting domain-containing protein [Hyunsoonleella aquatilis]MBC3758906.1 T9SS type A sorting domain-containing protein [Hyunsoonleella aquatilis]